MCVFCVHQCEGPGVDSYLPLISVRIINQSASSIFFPHKERKTAFEWKAGLSSQLYSIQCKSNLEKASCPFPLWFESELIYCARINQVHEQGWPNVLFSILLGYGRHYSVSTLFSNKVMDCLLDFPATYIFKADFLCGRNLKYLMLWGSTTT